KTNGSTTTALSAQVVAVTARLLTVSDPVVSGELWSVTLTPTSGTPVTASYRTTGTAASDVASNLATTLRGDGFIAVAGGGELGLIPSGRTVTTDVDAATTMPAAGTAPTNTETLTGPAHQNDIWTLRFDTTNTAYTFLADVTSADTIASTIAGAVPAVGGYGLF